MKTRYFACIIIFAHLFLVYAPLATGQIVNNCCAQAKTLCSTQSFVWHLTHDSSNGSDVSHDEDIILANTEVSNAAWFEWTVEESGMLYFTVTPLDYQDDIDFVLFKIQDDTTKCHGKVPIRVMLSGPVLGNESYENYSQFCFGATGLVPTSLDTREDLSGCTNNTDNFLSGVWLEAGERYSLSIYNFRSGGGFTMEFDGDATFKVDPVFCLASDTDTDEQPQIIFGTPFPNPATDILNLEIESPAPLGGQLKVVDVSGKIQYEQIIKVETDKNNYSIPIGHWPSGAYWITVTIEESVFHSFFVK